MKIKRILAGLGLAMLVVLAAWWPSNAWAVDDSVDSWQISYTVGTDGVAHVDETLVYRFGSDSGRHGIDRILTTREAWGQTDQDVVYDISNVKVSSPDASASFTLATLGSGRDQQLRIRVGSPDQIVTTPTATYTLSYDVAGAMRSTDSYDEFYWDAISDNTPTVSNISVSVSVPGGVKDVRCYSGGVQTSIPCTSANVGSDGVANFTEASKSAGDIMTISAMIGSGQVSDNQPHLVTRADQADVTAQKVGLGTTGAAALATAVGVGVMARRNRRDQRFVGVAPGTIDDSGHGVGPDDHPTIPVCFGPPDIPVAAAGLIDDGAVDVRDTTAALLSLAVRGVIQLRQSDAPKSWIFGGGNDKTIYARLVRTDVPMAAHEATLLRDVFPGLPIGTETTLTGQGTLYEAHTHMQANVRAEAAQAGWYMRLPAEGISAASAGAAAAAGSVVRALSRAFAFGVVGLLMMMGSLSLGALFQSLRWLAWAGPLVVVIAGLLIYRGLTHRGQRSAVGRAYADQVAGFREYLSTAEADQIKFEEGEDIFSQYLPWAVIFDLTDRWTKICSKLAAEGRLSNMQPDWYYGDFRTFNVFVFTNSLGSINQASLPVVQSSGSGFGGGSAFGGGGGFSGGGGGGGGVGSW